MISDWDFLYRSLLFSRRSEDQIHLQAPNSAMVKGMCCHWECGPWWLDSSASALFLPLLAEPPGPPDSAIIWQRDRKCLLTLRRNAVCGKEGAPGFCVLTCVCLGDRQSWVRWGAVGIRCPAGRWAALWERLQWAAVLLCCKGIHEWQQVVMKEMLGWQNCVMVEDR